MRIGIDFDNTLVCYDQLFWELAWESGSIDASVSRRKDAVRDNLRQRGLEPIWTKLQGEAYGPRILEASPFADALAAVSQFRERGWDVFVISHKTRTPIAGANYDLHAAARNWLKVHGFCGDEAAAPISSDQAFFELTKQDKLQRIGQLECDWFIDDLPELLTDAHFPPTVRRILFDPHDQVTSLPGISTLKNWGEAVTLLTKEQNGPGCVDTSCGTGSISIPNGSKDARS